MNIKSLVAAVTAVVFSSSVTLAHEVSLNGHVFTLPEGFEIELAAGPDLVPRPITAAFDELGRLYVADSSGTNDNVKKQLEDRPHRIVRLEDTNGDGKFDKSVVFADKMMFPEGTMWHNGSLYVSAPPSIWKLTDTNGDGVADKREDWFQATAMIGGCANDLHGPYLGPDGWIYWCKGGFVKQTYERVGKSLRVIKAGETPEETWTSEAAHIFRARPDGSGLEVVMTGGMDNPVDVVFTPGGERIFTTTFLQNPGGGKRDGLIHAIYGGVYGKQQKVVEDHKRTGELMPPLTHLGPAAPCGLAIYESHVIPEFRTNLFACQFNLRKVSRHVLVHDGASFKTQDHDFLVSTNLDFHPIDILEDADGSFLVVDTGGWYKLCCPTSQLHKPDVLGAIYRVRKSGAKGSKDPRGLIIKWPKLTNDELAALLTDERVAVRKRAIETLAERAKTKPDDVLASVNSRRGTKETAYPLHLAKISLLSRIDNAHARAAIRKFLADDNETTKQAALQAVSLWRDAAALPDLLKQVRTGFARNRRVAAEALGRIGDKSAVPVLLASAETLVDDRALEHSIIYALIEIADPIATIKGLESENPAVQRAALIAVDQMDGGGLNPRAVAELLSSPEPKLRETAAWIISRHTEWGEALAGILSLRLASGELSAADRAELEKQLAQFAKSVAVEKLLANAAAGKGVSSAAQFSALAAMRDSGLKEMPAEWVTAIVEILSEDNQDLSASAIAAARAVPAPKGSAADLAAALVKFARKKGLAPETRLDALAAVPGGVKDVDGETFIFLRDSLATDKAVTARGAAADVLAKAKLSDGQLTGLAHALTKAGPLETDRLLSAFEQSTDEQIGLKVLAALKTSPGRAGLRPGSLETKLAKYPASVQKGAFELAALANVDLVKQRAKLEELVEATKGGDIRRGQAVFMRTKTACNVCHQFGYVGGGLGPDLTRIGGIRSERDLLEAIVFPSASFVRSFEPTTVVTTGGKSFTGLVKKESSDELILATSATESARIPRDEIEETRPGAVSIMPSGLDQQLTVQELADLVAFLKNAK